MTATQATTASARDKVEYEEEDSSRVPGERPQQGLRQAEDREPVLPLAPPLAALGARWTVMTPLTSRIQGSATASSLIDASTSESADSPIKRFGFGGKTDGDRSKHTADENGGNSVQDRQPKSESGPCAEQCDDNANQGCTVFEQDRQLCPCCAETLLSGRPRPGSHRSAIQHVVPSNWTAGPNTM